MISASFCDPTTPKNLFIVSTGKGFLYVTFGSLIPNNSAVDCVFIFIF